MLIPTDQFGFVGADLACPAPAPVPPGGGGALSAIVLGGKAVGRELKESMDSGGGGESVDVTKEETFFLASCSRWYLMYGFHKNCTKEQQLDIEQRHATYISNSHQVVE